MLPHPTSRSQRTPLAALGIPTPPLGPQSSTSIPPGYGLGGTTAAAGSYQTNANGGCYWERLLNFGGNVSGIIANNFVSSAGNQVVSTLQTTLDSDGWRLRHMDAFSQANHSQAIRCRLPLM